MLSIITYPAPSLHEKSIEIDLDLILSKKIQTLIKEMLKTMYDNDGIGIAGPQVDKNIRLCIIGKESLKIGKQKNELPIEDLILINPVWQKTSRKKIIDTEGCLSVPKTFGKVRRYRDILVDAYNSKGEKIIFEAHDFLARVIQHEVDHLDGILFIDKAKNIYTTE